MEQKIKKDCVLGKNLRNLRIQRKLTQEQTVAQLQLLGCDITRSAYSKIEAGLQNISIAQLKALKSVFHATYEELLE